MVILALTYDVAFVIFVEIQLPTLLLSLNFIEYENLMWSVGVHIHSHGQQE